MSEVAADGCSARKAASPATPRFAAQAEQRLHLELRQAPAPIGQILLRNRARPRALVAVQVRDDKRIPLSCRSRASGCHSVTTSVFGDLPWMHSTRST